MTPKDSLQRQIQLDRRLLSIGAVLVGLGGALWVAGMVVTGSAVFGAARQWLGQLDQPPRELAKSKWQQLMAASAAGTDTWKKGPPPKVRFAPPE